MQGKTHIMVGVATTLAITQPNTIQNIILCIGTATIASTLPDIDIETSKIHKKARIASIITIILGIILGFLAFYTKATFSRIENIEDIKIIVGFIMFFIILNIGLHSKHRYFTHSLMAILLFSLSIYLCVPKLFVYFMIAYVSHILIDLLNKKKCMLLFPFDIGFCLNLCKSDGIVNKVLFVLGIPLNMFLIYTLIENVLNQIEYI